MQLLSSCLLSAETAEINIKFCSNSLRKQRYLWLKSLLLDCQEAFFRKEVRSWLFKLATSRLCETITSNFILSVVIFNYFYCMLRENLVQMLVIQEIKKIY